MSKRIRPKSFPDKFDRWLSDRVVAISLKIKEFKSELSITKSDSIKKKSCNCVTFMITKPDFSMGLS